VLATPALARDGAWYVGGEFGPMIVEDIDFDRNASQDALTFHHEYGYDGGLFVGYDLGAFRVEAEVSYRRARVDEIESSVFLPGQARASQIGLAAAPNIFNAGDGHTSALSGMINVMLDFGDDDGLSGFVGGGVGIARVSFDNVQYFVNHPAIVDDNDTGLAWQVIAGVRQAITPNIDVQLRYRFFNVHDVRMNGFVGGAGNELESRFRSHSLLGGIVFNFGAPPPPPLPLPIPVPVPVPVPPPVPVPVPPPPPQPIGPFIVFFDWDRADITPQAAAILDNAAQAYAAGGQSRVVLAGHADRSGSASYNVGLSQRRADAVRAYLAGRGVPEGAISSEAFGESRPLVETADGVREPQNRRVEIQMGPGSGW
jgi:opacity protein-like surface antigen